MTDDQMNLSLITGILDVLDRHGYARGDDEHTGLAILLTSDLAHIYEGSQYHPFGPYISEKSSSGTGPAPPGPASHDVAPVPAGEIKTLLSALLIAADDKRDRADIYADYPGHTCPTRESRLRDAQDCDRLSGQLIQAADASAAATASRPQPASAADREAVR